MKRRTLRVVALEESRSGTGPLASRLRAALPDHAIEEGSLETLEERESRKLDAVVMVLDEPQLGPGARHLAVELEEAGVAVLAVLAPDVADALRPRLGDVPSRRLDDPDVRIADALEGMLARQDQVRRLQQELAIARRSHGGLSGEMDKLQDELQLAAMIQRDVLPHALPERHGVRFGALFRPAHYVSGDVYLVEALDEDRIGMFIADCVGHGVPAALMTMVIARSVRMLDPDDGSIVAPAEMLRRLNRQMIERQGTRTRFATAAYAVIDCRARELTLAGAGHPPPVLLSPEGDWREIRTEGGLLGVFEDAEFDAVTVELPMDASLLMFSDGFEQAFPDEGGDPYERRLPTERYREEFAALGPLGDPQAMVAHVAERLDAASGSLHQLDDLTLVAAHAGPLAPHAGTPGATRAATSA